MVKHFSSLNFRHSISITHHSFFHTHLATSLLFSSLNFFTLFMGPTPVSRYSVFFFFLFFSFLFFSWVGRSVVFFFFLGLALAIRFFFIFIFYILASVSWVLKKKKKKKLYRLTSVGPMNSVKKLSDENKSDVAK